MAPARMRAGTDDAAPRYPSHRFGGGASRPSRFREVTMSPHSPSPFATGLGGRCPRCGQGRLFQGFLTLKSRCEACGLDYGFADSADGPAFFVMSIVGFIVVGLALWVEFAFQPPIWLHLLLWTGLSVVLCLALVRPLKGLMIALQFQNRAEEGRLKG
jgi:uncharacterized protein (DUF983 family)